MAGGQEHILRRRIKSVDGTQKITRAMELIAATRVVKAQQRASASRPYAGEITKVILDLVRAGAAKDHPLLQDHPAADTAMLVVVTSDRGLCGAYNSAVLRMAERGIKARRAEGRKVAVVAVGNKAVTFFRNRGIPIDAHLSGVTDRPTYDHARELGAAIRPRFEAGEVDAVDLYYWQFESAGSQRAVTQRFLPLAVPAAEATDGPSADLEYEPSAAGILSEILPRYVESRLYAALLEASASEHAARQRAMKAATDNAEELKTSLTRVMNRARQDAITTEIMEIVGGVEALSQDKGSSDDLISDLLVPSHLFRQQLDPLHQTPSMH